jgi:Dockerin type I domain
VVVEPGTCTLDGSIVNITPNLNSSCNGGVIEMIATSNTCDGYHIEIKTALGNPVHTAYYIPSGQTTSFNNLLPGDYEVRFFTTNWFGVSSSVCEEIIPFTVEDLGCVSPLILSTLPASAYGCADGTLIIEETDQNCDWQLYAYRVVDNYNFWNHWTGGFGTNQNGNQEVAYGGLYPGTYAINSVRSVYDYDGNLLECSVWDTVVVEPGTCTLDGSIVNITPNLNSSCNGGVIEMIATSNTCDGYHIEIKTALGNPVHTAYYIPSGQTTSFNNLLPGDYEVRFFTTNWFGVSSSVCEEIIPFTVEDLGCVSPLSISATPADDFCSSNGLVHIEEVDNACDYWQITGLYSNGGAFLISNSYPWQPVVYSGYLPVGNYSVISSRSVYNYDGNLIECSTLDYFTIGSISALDEDGDGFHVCQGDCDDVDNTVYPGAPPTGEGKDNNCDGTITSEEEVSCPADFNNDNVVNTTDLLLFISYYGCISSCALGDLNNDGFVNTTDLLLFISAYGSDCD